MTAEMLLSIRFFTTLALFEARAAMLLQASQFMHPKLSIINYYYTMIKGKVKDTVCNKVCANV